MLTTIWIIFAITYVVFIVQLISTIKIADTESEDVEVRDKNEKRFHRRAVLSLTLMIINCTTFGFALIATIYKGIFK